MENIIFYTLLLVCIILLFIVGYNFTKINKHKSNAQFWELSFNDISKRVKELTTKNTDLNTLLGIRDNSIKQHKLLIEGQEKTITEMEKSYGISNKKHIDFIEIQKQAMNERDTKLSDQAQLITKLTDELTIKNTTIESLTNALEDKHKQDKPFNVLDSLEDLIPRKEVEKPKRTKHKDN